MPDGGVVYEQVRQELVALVRGLDDAELDRNVAATPDWRVRDVVAHVAGVARDINHLDLLDDGDAWTARQVARFADADLDVVLAEWDEEGPAFAAGLTAAGEAFGAHFVGDLHAHLSDIRATLGLPPHDDPATVAVALDFYQSSLDTSLREEGGGTVVLVVDDGERVAGDGEPTATVRGTSFDVLRALSGRRSLAQIRAMDWSGDVDALAPRLSRYPLREADLPA